MTQTAPEMLRRAVRRLSPDASANRLVPLIAAGQAPPAVLGTLAMEQHLVVTSDRRSFLHLGERAGGHGPVAAFFGALADGESLAQGRLPALTSACGLSDVDVRGYEPLPGCQAYPAYAAWLALNGEPADVVVALAANFAAWGGYCASVADALRRHYGFDDQACAFFDFFAEPSPELELLARAAVQDGIDTGRVTSAAYRYGRLLQAYELMFWNTLADTVR